MTHRCGLRTLAWVLVLAVSASQAAPAAPAQGEDGEKIYQRTLKGTVWVLAPKGPGRMVSGTGSLIDVKRKLVLTSYHVVGDAERVLVLFAQFSNGKLVAERSYYRALLGKGGAINGKVLHVDTKRDLAILELDKVPAGVRSIPLSRDGAGPAQVVHSIGNPGKSDLLWEYTSGTVRGVGRKKWRVRDGTKFLEFEATMVETQSPTNPGDSGGPLVNTRGEMVGITQGMALDAQLLSLFVDISEVKTFLSSKKLLPKLPSSSAVASADDKPRPEREPAADADNAKKAEKDAASKLQFAKQLADDGKVERAKDRFQLIITNYPNTKAALEAKALLERLKQ